MVYIVGILGFIGGFSLALLLIGRMLKDRSREELLENKGLKLTYGLLAWGIAGFTAYCAIALYKYHFPAAG